ncbi:Na+-dependent transporter [Halobacteriales archaeon QS_1_68_17]|nr:MAG: Na+-dependent transporter [Halobacteriales archaeon QS_1_68_17]
MRLTAVVEDYLLAWILLAVGLGVAVPRIAAVTRYSTAILAVMIGSISLTLTVEQFRAIRPRTLGVVLLGHAAMPFLAAGLAGALGLPPALAIGFVVLGAVTPELVTPVMTELAGGNTALSTVALVVTGVGSVAFVPAVVSVLGGGVAVATGLIVEQLVVAVVAPMVLAVALRAWQPARVGRYDAFYPAVSAAMVVVIIGGVTAANAAVIRAGETLVPVVAGVVALNALGYALGWTGSVGFPRADRIASVLSVGMRDFAVAAALIVAAGLPAVASLPAVVFGVVEMSSSAALARYFRR